MFTQLPYPAPICRTSNLNVFSLIDVTHVSFLRSLLQQGSARNVIAESRKQHYAVMCQSAHYDVPSQFKTDAYKHDRPDGVQAFTLRPDVPRAPCTT